MRKSVALYFCLFTILLLHPSLAAAQSSTPAPSSTPRPTAAIRSAVLTQAAKQKERLENRTEKMEQKVASREAKVTERIGDRRKMIVERIGKQTQRMLDVSTKLIQHLDNIWGRVKNRIEKIKAGGTDVSSLTPLINTVETKRLAAIEATKAAAPASNVGDATDMQAAIRKFQTSFTTVRTAITAYHRAITDVIRRLQRIVPSPKITGTLTPTPSAIPSTAPSSTPTPTITISPTP